MRLWASGHIDKGREITRSGPYQFVRHPLYLGSALLGLGFVVAANNAAVAVLTLLYLGLTLTAAAGRALGTLLAAPSPAGDETATILLPLVQTPKIDAWPVLAGWLDHPDLRLKAHVELLRAESSRTLDETAIPALAALMRSGLDRSRLRAQLVLWSNVWVVEKQHRGLRISQMGARAIDRLAAEVLQQVVVRVDPVEGRHRGMELVEVGQVLVDKMRKGFG